MAGRNISASHVAFSSTRVMATCAVMGQAAGAAAAFCLKKEMLPQKIVKNSTALAQFQQMLLKDDQALIGFKNNDPADLARLATVTASSETETGPAVSVIDGVNRNIGDSFSHQWQTIITEPAPWIELNWEKPRTLRTIQLTFDSGLNRKLFMTGEECWYQEQILGAQPEIVADYEIQAEVNGEMQTIVNVADNFLRFVRHQVAPIETSKIRILLHRSQGDKLGRLFEIRCYA